MARWRWADPERDAVTLTLRLSQARRKPQTRRLEIDEIRVLLPFDATGSPFFVDLSPPFTAPRQLPTCISATTNLVGDTLSCSGGRLRVGETLTLTLRTQPAAQPGMGAELFVLTAGRAVGDFTVTGP